MRFPTAKLAPTSANTVVHEAIEVFSGRLDGITIKTSLAENLPPVRADGGLLRSVVVNLIDNAAEALETAALREIVVSTCAHGEAETVEICVQDTGHGISPEDKDRLFLPHFSTKNRGTGLGLAIAARIVAEHGGTIHVEDNFPVGSRFLVELPVGGTRARSRSPNETGWKPPDDHHARTCSSSTTKPASANRSRRFSPTKAMHVDSAASAEEALERAAAGDIEVVLLDVWLPGIDGLEALSRLQASPRPPAVIMISGHGTIETAVRATKLGAFDFIEKPLSLEKIIVLVRNAIQQRRLQEENQLLRSELGHRYQVIGESVPMKALRQQIAVTAPTNGRVLIFGESGTGKELVARSLHAASLRNKGLFVEVNCAAIPEDLIESELFGHIKGGFPGAAEDKIGKFKKADGGTLFLDEVGDMSLRTQSKVLRVLEEQRFEPVGSNQTVTVDVRVLAATNKNLEQEIARGAFRQDLFYRLNVIPFLVPPLRDRKEDIPILARYFLNEFSSAYGKRTRELSDSAMEILTRFPFPGNVRELRNLVERLVIVCPQARIEPHHLPPELFRGVAESPQHPYNTLHEARSAYEREFILRKLQENRWNMTQTATALGLERSHLYRKMKNLGIAAPD